MIDDVSPKTCLEKCILKVLCGLSKAYVLYVLTVTMSFILYVYSYKLSQEEYSRFQVTGMFEWGQIPRAEFPERIK